MTTTDAPAVRSWEALRRRIDGDVLLPGSPGYDRHRRPAIARFADVRPAAVVRCRAPADATAALRHAAARGVRLAVRGGGHSFAGESSTSGMLLDVRPMRAVAVRDGLVHVGAGARLGEVYAGLAEHGLALPLGCGATVGIAGLTLGGGLGVLGRRHGLTADRLVGADLVLADGRQVRCDDHRSPELLWCLRGGGAPAVVVGLTFRPTVAPRARAFVLRWPFAAAPAVVDAWQRWAPDAPDGVAAELTLDVPAAADAPGSVVLSGVLVDTDPTELDDVVHRGRAPTSAALTVDLPLLEAKRWLDGHSGGPARAEHAAVTSEFVARPLPTSAVKRLVDGLRARRCAGQARRVDLLPLGGAYNRVAPDASAFAHRRDRFLVRYEVAVPADSGPGERRAARAHLDALRAGLRPYGTGRGYRNFPHVRGGVDHDGTNAPRVTRVRRRYDPDRLFT